MKKSDLIKLEEQHGYPAVSIFLPTHKTVPEKLQDRIRVKNLLKEAHERLKAEYVERDITPLLNQLNKLNDLIDYTDTLGGLALFANAHTAQVYRLPFTVDERVVIDDNFETRDLIFTLNRTPQYWVLALSEKFTRLLHGIGNTLQEITGPTIDENGEKISNFPLDYLGPENRKILSIATGDKDSKYLDSHMDQYYRFIDDFFYKHYLQNDPLPVILAGTRRNIDFFKKITKHPKAYVATLEGNYEHDEFSPGQLAQKIWPIAQEYLANERKTILNDLEAAMSKGLYAFSFASVWRMANEGRIHKLLVETNFRKAGKVNSENPENTIIYNDSKAEGISDDLVDHLIEKVRKSGGSVIFFAPGTLESHDHIAAILRY